MIENPLDILLVVEFILFAVADTISVKRVVLWAAENAFVVFDVQLEPHLFQNRSPKHFQV